MIIEENFIRRRGTKNKFADDGNGNGTCTGIAVPLAEGVPEGVPVVVVAGVGWANGALDGVLEAVGRSEGDAEGAAEGEVVGVMVGGMVGEFKAGGSVRGTIIGIPNSKSIVVLYFGLNFYYDYYLLTGKTERIIVFYSYYCRSPFNTVLSDNIGLAISLSIYSYCSFGQYSRNAR